jgi:PAS domain S-box-containing protein
MHEQPASATRGDPFDIARLCRYFSESSPLPKLAVEGGTHIVRYVNPAFCRLVGKERSVLIGQPFGEAVPEGEENRCLSLLDRVYRTGNPECLAEQEHRSTRPAHWSYDVWAILGEDQRPTGVMIQVTDSTEIAIFRRQVTEMNQELMLSSIRQHELTETTEKLNVRLQTAIRHKDDFMAVLSHELRTPLTPVFAALALLQRNTRLDDETRELVEMIGRNITLEARLIDDLLDMTRIERGQMNLDRLPVDLCVVLEHAVEVCRPDLEAGKLTLEVDSEDGPILVEADAGRLQQVFWNLLKNSIKYSPVGGHVRVRCRRQGDSYVLAEVSDRGVGIDPELLPRLFTAFQKGDKDLSRKFGGLGLGLAISRAIVDLHGGTVTAQSGGKDKGAIFSVRLPIMAGVRSVPAEETLVWTDSQRPIRPLLILLVEDHADSGKAMRQLLTAFGHTMLWASDVATGLRLARQNQFDLLISDLGLPDGSGLDLMSTLRHQGSTLPGIVLSGYGQDQDIVLSREAGFATHLTKPVDIKVLQAAICKVTGSDGAFDSAGVD